MSFKDILSDKKILDEFKKIDMGNDNRFNHGLAHTQNVINNMQKLVDLLKIEEPEKDYLLIACALHDIGQLGGNEEHSIRSKNFASNYLKGLIDSEGYNKIISAIEHHHQKENRDKLPLFEYLVIFADRMDFTYKRLDKNYVKTHNENFLEKHILSVGFGIKDNNLEVIITTDKKITEKDFKEFEYYPKISGYIKQLSERLNMNYKIVVN